MLKPQTRIRLIHMPNDPCPIPGGTTGTVIEHKNPGKGHPLEQVEVEWDIPRSLALLPDVDLFEVITSD